MKNIIVTGGAGFIGSHVVRLFVNKYPEYNIINLDILGSCPSSTSKNSWKDILEILATASNEVKARAETNIVIMHNPHD